MHHRRGGLEGDGVHAAPSQLAVFPDSFLHFEHRTLHDNHRPIDDNSKVDGPQAHQVGAHAKEPHHDEGEQQGQRNDRCGDDTSAQTSQQQHQHEYHDERPFCQIARNGARCTLDKVGPIEKRFDVDAVGQRFSDTLHALLHRPDHLVRVGTLEHHDHAPDGLMTVLRESAVPHLRAKAHLVGYVAHEDRGAVDILHHDVLNVVNRLHQSFAPDEAGHVVTLYVGAARVDVILSQGFVHLAHAHAHGVEPLGVEGHLVLLDASAKRVDLHHARNHGQLALHYPVLNGAQLLRTVTGGVFGNKGVL